MVVVVVVAGRGEWWWWVVLHGESGGAPTSDPEPADVLTLLL